MIENSLRTAVDLFHRNVIYPYLTRGEAQDDREIAHEKAIDLMARAQNIGPLMAVMSKFFAYQDPILGTYLFNRWAPNPLGIAAGFDKNARAFRFLGEGLGFGIVKVGSITYVPYEGNPRPRIFDLPLNDGLINRMGFPGEGTTKIEPRLKREQNIPRDYLLIVNIAASKPSFERGTAIEDYGAAYKQMLSYGDGVEINVSSPNTEGVRGLQEPEIFEELASHIERVRKNSRILYQLAKLLIYKFGPDLPFEKLERDLRIAIDHGADAVTLTNTTTDPEVRKSLRADQYREEAGGMSGALLEQRALEVTHRAYEYVGDELVIFRAGGIGRSARDLWDAFTYGGAKAADAYASFVRFTTSTPNFTVYRLRELAKAMRAAGMTGMNDFKQLRGKKVPFPLS